MFFETQSEYTIIENKTLKQICEEEKVEIDQLPLTNDDILSNWTNYCWIISEKNKLNLIHRGIFTYYITLFMTGIGQSCNAEEYFKQSLEKKMMSLYEQVKLEFYDEIKQKQQLFEEILNYIKSNQIINDERALYHNKITLSPQNYELLKNMKGKQWNDKIINALHKSKCDKEIDNTGAIKQLTFNLTWSQKQEFDKISDKGATVKLLYILGGLEK